MSRSQAEVPPASSANGTRERGQFEILKRFSILIPFIMLPLGAWLGQRAFHGRAVPELLQAVLHLPAINLALALACAAGSYLCLTFFDFLAVRYIGRRLSYGRVALSSFIALGIDHTVGVAVLSSGALRYRLYSGFGLSAADVAKIILFCALTVGIGLMTLAGIILTWRPEFGPGAIGVAPGLVRLTGALCLALVLLYIVVTWRRKEPFRFRGRAYCLPGLKLAVMQVAAGTLDFAFVAATLYWLLAGAATYPETVSAYVLANVSVLVSHVPGGIGVLEYVVSSVVSRGPVIEALIAFRIIYFLIPLVLATAALAATEVLRWCTAKARPS